MEQRSFRQLDRKKKSASRAARSPTRNKSRSEHAIPIDKAMLNLRMFVVVCVGFWGGVRKRDNESHAPRVIKLKLTEVAVRYTGLRTGNISFSLWRERENSDARIEGQR